MRSEQEIFGDLAKLCTSPGYAHAIAYLCFRDSIVHFDKEMTAKDLSHLFSMSRLIRTEITTLIGLLMKEEIDYSLPAPAVLQEYLDRTEALLEELHQAIADAAFSGCDLEKAANKNFNPFSKGEALREPIFYNGESAYSFQFRDFAPRKYAADNEWLQLKRGFSIQAARDIVHAVARVQTKKLSNVMNEFRGQAPSSWTLLPCFSFTIEEIAEHSGIDRGTTSNVLVAFSPVEGERNQGFKGLHDFNVAAAMPLLRGEGGTFFTFGYYGFAEALYEAPFYWMSSDADYRDIAMAHRGRFTEELSKERLELVFGKGNVYGNVEVCEVKGKKAGEIDVLVLFGDRAIVLQAKSKRLTLEARRGNDRQIKEDFQKSVQDSYDQAQKCAKLLGDPKYTLLNSERKKIPILTPPKEIYILCVVSDNYPALNFQAQHLLKVQTSERIYPPLVADVFTLDAMTEMLASPLYFLSYINRRTGYYDRLLARDELTLLAWHLKKNIWVPQEYGFVLVEDEICADLDIAMSARRDNVPGQPTPEGILTRVSRTALGQIVKQIEAEADVRTIDLGFVLLRLSEHAMAEISKGIIVAANKAKQDLKHHDISVPLLEAGTGLTLHFNDDPLRIASERLQRHCLMRKYIQKVKTWYGICLAPADMSVRFGVNLDFVWEKNAAMDSTVKRVFAGNPTRTGSRKIGRNDPCPCGSGAKAKKCCFN